MEHGASGARATTVSPSGSSYLSRPAALPPSRRPLRVVVAGSCGCGKTTIGKELAAVLGLPLIEGDDLHPAANVAKMARGEPLDDADRAPWLSKIRAAVGASQEGAAASCSALKQMYRDALGPARIVLLDVPEAVARERVERGRATTCPRRSSRRSTRRSSCPRLTAGPWSSTGRSRRRARRRDRRDDRRRRALASFARCEIGANALLLVTQRGKSAPRPRQRREPRSAKHRQTRKKRTKANAHMPTVGARPTS